jgi:K+-sensing histidine kinase KdpD
MTSLGTGYRSILVLLIGAICGALLAVLVEFLSIPSWAFLLMLICSVGISATYLIFEGRARRQSAVLRAAREFGSLPIRLGFVIVMIVLTLAIEHLTGINPRDYAYVPLLPPVILSAVLFGFGPSLFAVVLCTLAAIYFFAPPVFSFAMDQWEDIVGVGIFAVIGGLVGLAADQFLSFE